MASFIPEKETLMTDLENAGSPFYTVFMFL